MTTGERIKELRLKKGISQRELARRIDMSGQMISKIESSSTDASLETLLKISNVLEVELNDLVDDSQLRKRGYPIRHRPKKIQDAISTSLNTDSAYNKRENSFIEDIQTIFEDAFDEEVQNLFLKRSDDKALSKILRLMLKSMCLEENVDISDDTILEMFYSNELKTFMSLLLLRYHRLESYKKKASVNVTSTLIEE